MAPPPLNQRPAFRFVAANLRAARKLKGLTQQSLAERAGIDVTYVQAIERGAANLTVAVLCDLADAVGVDPGQFFQAVSPEPRPTGRPALAKFEGRSGRAVLVVDDDEAVLKAVGLTLSGSGWTVISCGSGRDALQHLERGDRPAVILLDQRMPDMDGDELLRVLRTRPSLAGIPVVGMSASAWPGAGSLVLGKPFETKALLAAVVAAVEVEKTTGPKTRDRSV
jgi:CheY-like chemotaxis protein/DNA-binding XRE family transcriptional regulator